MRQNPRVESPTQPTIALHSVLSSALVNLDIQLEDELARYRRQRLGGGRTAQKPGRQRSAEVLDLITVPAITGGRSTAASEPVPAFEARLAGLAGAPTAPDAYKPTPAFTANPQPFEGAIALSGLTQPSTHDDADESRTLAPAAPNLDDYLESSEELLRSLADEQAEVQAERNFMHSLLTPLGLGSMLLLLLSSAMFGYVIMNPSSLPWLTAKSSNQTATAPAGMPSGQGVVPAPQPDLAKRELPDLNLNNLGTVNVTPGTAPSSAPATKATPTPSSKPTIAPTTVSPSGSQPSRESAAPPSSSTQAAPSSPSRPSPVRTYEPPQSATSSQAAVAPRRSSPKTYSDPVPPTAIRATAPTAARSASGDAYPIKVITHYDSDSALTKSQAVVPDAYLRNFPTGAKIQLGAYGDRASAEAKARELRDRGIPAEVYSP